VVHPIHVFKTPSNIHHSKVRGDCSFFVDIGGIVDHHCLNFLFIWDEPQGYTLDFTSSHFLAIFVGTSPNT
jgi:hypothetical protein